MYNSIEDLDIKELNSMGIEVHPFRSVPKKRIKSGVDLYLAVEESETESHVRLEYPFSQEQLDEAILDMEYANEEIENSK